MINERISSSKYSKVVKADLLYKRTIAHSLKGADVKSLKNLKPFTDATIRNTERLRKEQNHKSEMFAKIPILSLKMQRMTMSLTQRNTDRSSFKKPSSVEIKCQPNKSEGYFEDTDDGVMKQIF